MVVQMLSVLFVEGAGVLQPTGLRQVEVTTNCKAYTSPFFSFFSFSFSYFSSFLGEGGGGWGVRAQKDNVSKFWREKFFWEINGIISNCGGCVEYEDTELINAFCSMTSHQLRLLIQLTGIRNCLISFTQNNET